MYVHLRAIGQSKKVKKKQVVQWCIPFRKKSTGTPQKFRVPTQKVGDFFLALTLT